MQLDPLISLPMTNRLICPDIHHSETLTTRSISTSNKAIRNFDLLWKSRDVDRLIFIMSDGVEGRQQVT